MKKFFFALAVLVIAAAGFLVFGKISRSGTNAVTSDCGIPETRQVRGISMQPLLTSGEMVSVLAGYYGCHPIGRGDLVAYHYAGDTKAPLVKQVGGIPGDSWNLEKADDGTFLIVVNGSALRNAAGELYKIPGAKLGELQLYASGYPVIPSGAYLLLGEMPGGSMDSVEFGLVGAGDILGKVVKSAVPTIAAKDFSSRGGAVQYLDASPSGWTCTIASANNQTAVTAHCSSTQQVISGGCGTQNGDVLTDNEPVTGGWTCSVGNFDVVHAYANCCQ
ncbi:MAG: signal peptidase I [Patescibacteria group bacterium]|nr:signal peptidase I [Patescibacteria group bacterium]